MHTGCRGDGETANRKEGRDGSAGRLPSLDDAALPLAIGAELRAR